MTPAARRCHEHAALAAVNRAQAALNAHILGN